MSTPAAVLETAGRGAAEVLSANLGVAIGPDVMLDIRETPTGLCRLVLEVLGLAHGGELIVPVPPPVNYWLAEDPATPVVETRRVQTWRLRALEGLTPPRFPGPDGGVMGGGW